MKLANLKKLTQSKQKKTAPVSFARHFCHPLTSRSSRNNKKTTSSCSSSSSQKNHYLLHSSHSTISLEYTMSQLNVNNTNTTPIQTSTFYLNEIDTAPVVSHQTSQIRSSLHEEHEKYESESPTTSPKQEITSFDLAMQDFLEHARNGNVNRITEFIESSKSLTPTTNINNSFDINYKGKPKRFYGWTALHISCYFNHLDIVKLLLEVINFIFKN